MAATALGGGDTTELVEKINPFFFLAVVTPFSVPGEMNEEEEEGASRLGYRAELSTHAHTLGKQQQVPMEKKE